MKQLRKLSLERQVLRVLDAPTLTAAHGGVAAPPPNTRKQDPMPNPW